MEVHQRWKLVKKNKLCFCCLRSGHSSLDCRKKRKCSVTGCQKDNHHPLLHFDEKRPDSDAAGKQELPQHQGFFGQCIDSDDSEVLLKVLPVTLRGPSGCVDTFALLDDGSTGSIIEADLAEELGLIGQKFLHTSTWLDGTKRTQNSSRVSCWINGNNCEEYMIDNVKTKADLSLPSSTIRTSKLKKKWPYLRCIPLVTMKNCKPRILIGSDNCHLTLSRKTVEGSKNGPVAVLTRLGWVLHGPVNKYRDMIDEDQMFYNFDEELHQLVKEQFKLDSIGIQPNVNVPKSKMDARADYLMQQNTIRKGDRWETCLLWKEDGIHLPESKEAGLRRLKTLEKQMDKDENFAERYCLKIQEYVEKGFCRKLSSEEIDKDDHRKWYIPHFGRINPNKPAKLRFLLDCAGKSHGMCLNDALLQGSDLLTPLISVLAKFRQKEIAFSGDIRDMFHMILVRKEDSPALRFFWRGRDRTMPPDVYEMNVLVFGAVSSPYQAQRVKNRNAEDFRGEFPDDTVDAIRNRHYVDDYLDSVSTVDEAVKKIADVREIHRRGGFEIRGFLSNSEEVLKLVDPAAINESLSFGEDESTLERVLGLYWDPRSDTFRFKKRFRTVDDAIVKGDRLPSKREVLKLLMCIFDPLGFLSHLTIRGKIQIQDIWRAGLGWDDKIPSYMEGKWKNFISQTDELEKVEIPRCYSPGISTAEDIQLHVLCDASEQAYCCSAYLRTVVNGEVKMNIICAKTRVAPLKVVSIPRLELQAALMGARMASWIKENHEIKIDKVCMWSDSRNVLCWLRSEDPRRFKTYVANRIGEILELTDVSWWRWVPTEQNVADDGTRDHVPADISKESRFFVGPAFLHQPETEWPVEVKSPPGNLEALEMKNDVVLFTTNEDLKLNMDLYWLDIITGLAKKRFAGQCLAEHLRSAEKELLVIAQQDSFPEEMDLLQRKKSMPKSSKLLKLAPYLDNDGIIRMKSRVCASPDLEGDAKSPVILDSKNRITRKIIDHYHRLFNHQGQEMLVNEFRQRFWIIGIRSAVRSAGRRCEQCQKETAKPAEAPMAPLPEFRVTKVSRPFTNVGIDHFGPIEVVVKRSREKRYGLVFTCMNTRAIHIEVCHSLDTNSTLQAIERFVNRRGAVIWSDNGRSFIRACGVVKEELNEIKEDEILMKLSRQGIEWKFIPPLSPHFGGAWERMVRCIKKTMRAIPRYLRDKYLNDEMLLTIMAEVEAIVNSRPLTFVSKDNKDVEAITPNSFLIGTTSVLRPPGNFSDHDLTHKKRWRMCQIYCEHIWRRWVKEVLPSLAPRQKWNEEKREIRVGDKVLIADGNLPRNSWIVGVVTDVIVGNDGHVRVADVKTEFGTYRRPVVKLCPIIVESESDANGVVSPEGV